MSKTPLPKDDRIYNGKYSGKDIDKLLYEAERNVANTDYIAMMLDIELNEPEEVDDDES